MSHLLVANPEDLTIAELVACIWQWGADRNITREGGSSSKKQLSKAAEEIMELSKAHYTHNYAEECDAIGDILVCLIQAIRISYPDAKALTICMIDSPAWMPTGAPDISADKQLELINADLIECEEYGLVSLSNTAQLINRVKYWALPRGVDLHQALIQAWSEIQFRKGTMIAGKFVKSED